jgi:hypothetical protein
MIIPLDVDSQNDAHGMNSGIVGFPLSPSNGTECHGCSENLVHKGELE